jgi:hypothetical protein
MTKKRLLFVLNEYPQISETYIASEINALWNNFEIEVLSFNKPDLTYRHSVPYHHIPHTDRRAIANLIKRFSPDIVHGHYIFLAELLRDVSKSFGVPFTSRAHSFDILGVDRDKVARKADAINSPYCLGVLTFPFTVPLLESAGINRDKIQGCWPVVDVERFYDTSTNGKYVMNLGACIPKKKFEDFLRLAQQVPEKNFNLYALGYKVEEIKKTNDSMGDPVTIIPPIEPRDMPREYKKHEWLVYTACPRLATVGWPMAVAEAQASGVGVCLRNIRPDVREFVGDAGYLFDDVEDAKKIICQPFSPALRELGFEHARKSDVRSHIHQLEDLWAQA